MTSITSLFSGQYSSASDEKKTNANSLADMLSGANSSGKQGNLVTGTADVSYLLNLSEEARNYLASQTNKTDSTDGTGEGFVLSAKQQQMLDSIIEKYKDQPFTQPTFDAMLKELEGANLGPEQMAATDQVKQMNTTQLFLNAMNGTDSPLTFSSATGETQKAKADNYLQAIYDQWEKISTTAEPQA